MVRDGVRGDVGRAARYAVVDYDEVGEIDGTLAFAVRLAASPENPALTHELRRRYGAGGYDPMQDRKIVDMERDGEIVSTMVQVIPGLTALPLAEYEDDPGEPFDGVVVDDAKKVYELHQLFSDVNVSDKLRFTARYLQHIRRVAVENPARAAALVQERLRAGGFPNYVVKAGRYAHSRAQAKRRVQSAAEACRAPPPCVFAEVIDAKLFMYCTDVEGHTVWSVYGPLANAFEIQCMFKLAMSWGTHEAVFAFAMEVEILDITVWDDVTNTVVSAAVVQHAGPEGILSMGYTLSPDIPYESRQAIVAREPGVLPVTRDGLVIGTAVRLTSRYLLVSEHVANIDAMESSDGSSSPVMSREPLKVNGRVVTQRGPIGRDMWVVEMSGSSTDWIYRAPRISEKVVMCYSVGTSVEYTSVSRVLSFDHNTFSVTTFPEARPGASGGVVMSVSDGAMLGVYTGEARNCSMCSVFSPEHFGRLGEFDEPGDTVSRSDAADGLFKRLEARGLKLLMQGAIAATVPLYAAGVSVGVAVSFGGRLYTSVNPDEEQLYTMSNGAKYPLVFDHYDGKRYVSKGPLPPEVRNGVPTSRCVELNEKVLLVAADADGPYMSKSERVQHVGASGMVFHAKDFGESHLPFDGAAVFAERDGAIVGQFSSRVDGPGGDLRVKRSLCFGIPAQVSRESVVVESVRPVMDGIASTFPFLNTVTWPAKVVDDVFTHGSIRNTLNTMEKYAMIGDAAARMQLYKTLMAIGLPYREWATVSQSLQSSARLSDVCVNLGLDDLYKRASHVSLPKGSKLFADLLDAFIGLVSEFESPANLSEVCKVMGLLYDSSTPLSTEFRLPHSRSASPSGSVNTTRNVSGLRTSQLVEATESVDSPVEAELADLRTKLDELTKVVGSPKFRNSAEFAAELRPPVSGAGVGSDSGRPLTIVDSDAVGDPGGAGSGAGDLGISLMGKSRVRPELLPEVKKDAAQSITYDEKGVVAQALSEREGFI